jgi:hypothetical protein
MTKLSRTEYESNPYNRTGGTEVHIHTHTQTDGTPKTISFANSGGAENVHPWNSLRYAYERLKT